MLGALKGAFNVARKGSMVKAAMGATRSVGKAAWWAARKTTQSAIKRPMTTTIIGSLAIGLYGGGKGVNTSMKMMQPVKPQKTMMQPLAGPGYNLWAGPAGGRQFNLGATGDLTLSLHKTRHK